MIWTGDDVEVSRKAQSRVPRDNVILEYGYFAAALGRTRCLMIADHKIRVPTDTRGLTYIPMDRATHSSLLDRTRLRLVLDALRIAIEREGIHPSRRYAVAFSSSQMVDADAEIVRLMRMGIRGLSRVTGIRESLGLHLWLLVETPKGPKMRRYARHRLSDDARPNNWGDFAYGKGLVGNVWRTNRPIFWSPSDPQYGAVSDPASWMSLTRDSRIGMTWKQFSMSRSDFEVIGGVPLTGNSARPVGALTCNVGRGTPNAKALSTPKARDWMEEVAAILWDALSPDFRQRLELLAQL